MLHLHVWGETEGRIWRRHRQIDEKICRRQEQEEKTELISSNSSY
jgi:hypothetical protein